MITHGSWLGCLCAFDVSVNLISAVRAERGDCGHVFRFRSKERHPSLALACEECSQIVLAVSRESDCPAAGNTCSTIVWPAEAVFTLFTDASNLGFVHGLQRRKHTLPTEAKRDGPDRAAGLDNAPHLEQLLYYCR